MEQDSMSNIWNSNCIMQARRTAGRRWGDGSALDLFNCQFNDIKVEGRMKKWGRFQSSADFSAPSAPFASTCTSNLALSCGSESDVFCLAQLILQSEEKELPQQNSSPQFPLCNRRAFLRCLWNDSLLFFFLSFLLSTQIPTKEPTQCCSGHILSLRFHPDQQKCRYLPRLQV